MGGPPTGQDGMKLQAQARPGLAGLTGAWSFSQEVRRGTRLDKRLSVVLNGCILRPEWRLGKTPSFLAERFATLDIWD